MESINIKLPFVKEQKTLIISKNITNYSSLRGLLNAHLGIDNYLLYCNGKVMNLNTSLVPGSTIHVSMGLPGGKGGFGSMLRAIGAQIEKTTNREACRDLSGRRLRDINEEQRLKKWISKKAEREAEKLRRRKERIERLKSQPKHNFVDFEYEKEISQLPERIDDALTAGIQKNSKRPSDVSGTSSSKKKRLWLEDEISGSSSDSDYEPKLCSAIHLGCKSSEEGSSIDAPGSSRSAEIESQETSSSSDSHSTEEFNKEPTNAENLFNENENLEQHKSPGVGFKQDVSEGNSSSTGNYSDENETNSVPEKKHEASHTISKPEDENSPIDLKEFQSASDLECLGLERLKCALIARGLKCGGSLSDRAQRLWIVRDLEPTQYPKNLLAKQKK